MSSEPTTRKNVALVSLATALARRVLPGHNNNQTHTHEGQQHNNRKRERTIPLLPSIPPSTLARRSSVLRF